MFESTNVNFDNLFIFKRETKIKSALFHSAKTRCRLCIEFCIYIFSKYNLKLILWFNDNRIRRLSILWLLQIGFLFYVVDGVDFSKKRALILFMNFLNFFHKVCCNLFINWIEKSSTICQNLKFLLQFMWWIIFLSQKLKQFWDWWRK